MVVIMNPDAREENIMAVVKAIESVGLTAKIMEGPMPLPSLSVPIQK